MAVQDRITLGLPPSWLLPADLATRYASAIAEACGILVTVEVPGRLSSYPVVVTWRGSEAQFRATGIVVPSARFDFKARRTRFCPAWLRGYLYREGADLFRFDIEWANRLSKIQTGRLAQFAANLDAWQRFKNAMLAVDVGTAS